MHAIQIHAFGSRVAGRITKRVALGTTLTETISKLTGFFLVLFLPALAMIERLDRDGNRWNPI